MPIDRAVTGTSAICHTEADRIEIRGRDLCKDLMGRMTFTEYFYFLVTGQEASERQRFFLDLLLVAIAEHGLTPSAQVARMTYAAAPDSLQGAVAAGILGCGPVILGAAETCGIALSKARKLVADGETTTTAALRISRETRARGERIPGFGHPIHNPRDPRAERILELAEKQDIAGVHVELARRFREAVAEVSGKRLPMNVSMPIAAVLLDLDFPASMIKAIPILARTGGLLAHIAEEQQRPIGFLMASQAENAIGYGEGGPLETS